MDVAAVDPRPALLRRFLPLARGIGEVVLFAFALFIAIPPVPSSPDEVHGATSTMWLGGPAFFCFLLLARIRIGVAMFLLPVYLAFVWGVHERVFLFS